MLVGDSMADFFGARREMIDCQIRTADVTKYSILEAMSKIPREKFVPTHLSSVAYSESNLNIGSGRYLLEPRVFAKMLNLLDVTPKDLVLDIASGYGYSCAVLASLAEAVVAVEDEYFAKESQTILDKEAIHNAIVYEGRLTQGLDQQESADAIIIQGGIEKFPYELEKQAKIGGRIAAIFVDGMKGSCWKGLRTDKGIDWSFGFDASVPVLTEFTKQRQFTF